MSPCRESTAATWRPFTHRGFRDATHPRADYGVCLVGPTIVLMTENSSNERLWIATDDASARDHIVWLHANARTKSIIWVRPSIMA
jgi:hypothetical protein